MLRVVKMEQLIFVVGDMFYANGDPPLETMQTASLASSDSHL